MLGFPQEEARARARSVAGTHGYISGSGTHQPLQMILTSYRMSDATEPKLERDSQFEATMGVMGDGAPPTGGADDDDDDEGAGGGKQQKERRKIEIKFIQDKLRRHITFSKRKAGIMKKAYELSVLTGTQVLLLVVLETGLVYTFTTPKLQPLVTKLEGKNLIQACLNAPEEGLGDGDGGELDGNLQDLPDHSPAPQQGAPPPQPMQPMQQAPPPQPGQQGQHPMPGQQMPGHMPQGIPYGAGHPQPGMHMPPNYPDQYQQYLPNYQNGNMPNHQQYQ